MDKGTQVEQIREAARLLKSAGIRACFFLQFGYPGETRADIEQTLQLVRDGDPDDIGVSVSYPMPGTKFFEAVHAQLGEKQNWQDSSDLAMLYQERTRRSFTGNCTALCIKISVPARRHSLKTIHPGY
jgi:radical SAM superfamily enzyme YgiQ (UPF0313 family)